MWRLQPRDSTGRGERRSALLSILHATPSRNIYRFNSKMLQHKKQGEIKCFISLQKRANYRLYRPGLVSYWSSELISLAAGTDTMNSLRTKISIFDRVTVHPQFFGLLALHECGFFEPMTTCINGQENGSSAHGWWLNMSV